MLNKNQRIRVTVLGLLALIALVLGLFISQYINFDKKINLAEVKGTVLSQPREVATFTLTGIDNLPFSNTSLKDHWTMMFFGFTQCGSICPTIMAELSKMYQILKEKNVKILPKIIMVSVDPERDTLEKLGHYVKAFNPQFYGARGEDKMINQMTKEMGIAYMKIALQDKENRQDYNIEHTGTLMLFNPEGELVAFFTTPHQAISLAKDYLIVSNQGKLSL